MAQSLTINKNAGTVRVPDEACPRVRDYLGRVPSVHGESPARYLEFRRKLDEDLKPVGPIQEMYVESLARAYWDFIRYSALKTDFLSYSATDGLERLLRAVFPEEECAKLLQDYRARDPGAIGQVQQLIDSLGINSHEIAAQALAENISVIQKFELLISMKEKAWQKAHKEFEKHSELLARRFRAFAGIKEDEQFRGIPHSARRMTS